ncbi:MAG: ABC transporter substrate-binding protein [Bacillota bacterium]|nr:ABC transporter substrate-binding protein [Bacillota bacterium]
MNKRRLICGVVGLVLCLALFAGGCAGGKSQAPQKEKALYVHLYMKPAGLNPISSSGQGQDRHVLNSIYNNLVRLSDKYEVVPDLCERYEVSPDAKVFTFYLPKNAKWHDGKPVTADDVVFTFNVMLNPKSGSWLVGKLSEIKGSADYKEGKSSAVAGVTKVDDYTVRVELEKPDVGFLALAIPDMYILPKHVLESASLDQLGNAQTFRDKMIGSGPYKFVKYETDQYVEVVKNPDYWRGKPKLDRVFFKVLTTDVAVAQMEKGEIDIAKISATDAGRLAALPHVQVLSVPGAGIFQMGFNLQQPYLQDKRIRQAFAYAIDREGILKTVLQGHGRVVNSPIIGPEWAVNPNLNPYKYDPEKARQLLKEARWDTNRKLVWIYIPGIRDRDAAYPVMQQQLKEAGINVEFKPVEAAVFAKMYLAGTTDWDLASFGGGVYGAEPHVSSQYYLSWNHTPKGANGTHYVNPRIDDLYMQGCATPDRATRQQIYYEIASILNEDMPTVFFWANNEIWAVNKRVAGCKPPGTVHTFGWDVFDWGIVEQGK